MCIKLSVKHKHVITLFCSFSHIGMLGNRVSCIEVHQRLVLVGLVFLDDLVILLEGEVLACSIFIKSNLRYLFKEFLLGDHAVLDEQFKVIPFLFKSFPVLLEDVCQAVGHFLCDMPAYFLDVGIALQIAPGNVQRDIRGIYHSVQQCQEVRDNAFHRVSHEYLVAVQLYLVFLNFEVVPDLREVEDPGQFERIIDVQVDVEERLLAHRVQLAVEACVVLILQVSRFACPGRLGVVDDLRLSGIDHFPVLPLLLIAKLHLHWQEAAVFLQEALNAVLFEELL